MQFDLIAIAIAYALGLLARFIGLPPLVGYMFAGFALYAAGGQLTPTLSGFSNMGVTLLLFSIGLKLRIKSLLMPQIWAVASLHMLIIVVISAAFIMMLGIFGVSLFTGLDPVVIAIIAFALSFSSTVFAVKVLEEKGEMYSLYGRISIGILIMQDIAAVLFLAISTGKIPSIWALALLLLIPLRPLLYRLLEKSGHGELQVLFGLTLALGGAQLFELVSVKGDLGALILGIMLANHARASDLARQLLSFKDLFLVGFFLSIGLSGPLSWDNIIISLLLLLLIPLKTILFFGLLSKFHLRARTSLLTSLSLANYSEFGLIVIGISVSNGWLGSEWLLIVAIALSLSFIIAAPLNGASYRFYSNALKHLTRFESSQRLTEEKDIYPGEINVVIFGMGRVGQGAYDVMCKRPDQRILGVDIDEDTVNKLTTHGLNVIRGSVTAPDFWSRIHLDRDKLNLILLATPKATVNLFAIKLLIERGYTGKIAVVAKYADEIESLQKAGAHAVFNLYAEAGVGFAEHVCQNLLSECKK